MPKLTSRSIKKIVPPAPGTGSRDTPDSIVVGLCVTTQPSGVKSFTLRYRLQGVGKRFTLGRFPTMDLGQARKRARELLEQIEQGVDPQPAKVAERTGELTDGFVEQATRFIETYARLQNKSWIAQARLLGLSLNKAAVGTRH